MSSINRVEEHDRLCSGVVERVGAGTGRIELGTAVEMDDGSVLGKRWEVQCVERDEARNDVVASSSTILTISSLFWRRLGMTRETSISASFGGAQLDRRRSDIERGQELRETHATRLALFPTHQEDISTLASRTSENRERGSLGQNVAVAENQTY